MGANYSESRNLTDEQLMLIEQYIVPQTWGWVSVFFHVIVFIVGLFGNILVCVAVYRNHSMRTVTNYFIVNLAVADALVILFCLPFSVVWDVTSTWWFGTAMCKFVLNIQNVSVTVSILTLTFISIDRWYAICHPIAFRSTTGKAKTAICIIWIVSFICVNVKNRFVLIYNTPIMAVTQDLIQKPHFESEDFGPFPPSPDHPPDFFCVECISDVYLWVAIGVIIAAAIILIVILTRFCRNSNEPRSSLAKIITHIELPEPVDDPQDRHNRTFRMCSEENVKITIQRF